MEVNFSALDMIPCIVLRCKLNSNFLWIVYRSINMIPQVIFKLTLPYIGDISLCLYVVALHRTIKNEKEFLVKFNVLHSHAHKIIVMCVSPSRFAIYQIKQTWNIILTFIHYMFSLISSYHNLPDNSTLMWTEGSNFYQKFSFFVLLHIRIAIYGSWEFQVNLF